MQQQHSPQDDAVRIWDDEDEHLLASIRRLLAVSPQHALFSVRQGDRFVDRSVSDVWSRIAELANGLIASGVEVGDRVVLMAPTSPDWLVCDQAINAVGAVTVPVYETSSEHQVEWILEDSAAVLAIVHTDATRNAIASAASSYGCREVLSVESGDLDLLAQRGRTEPGSSDNAELDRRIESLGPASIATIIYTSGTTGRPKGCVLTHRNLRANVHQVSNALGDAVGPTDTVLLFLPLAHILAKMTALYGLERGVKIAFATSIAELPTEFAMAKPTLITAVPRIFEKVFHAAQHTAEVGKKGWLFDRSVRTAIASSRQVSSGSVSIAVRIEHAVFQRLVYDKIAAGFGGNLRMAFSGGGPLGERLTSFFDGIGIRIYEGYGLTETSPILTINSLDSWRSGTVGLPVIDTDLTLSAEGEILVRGPQVFGGYWHNDAATSEAIDGDGWFHTGDVGSIDDDGFVRITGRIKDIIVTAAGKNVAPAPLEDRLRAHTLVSQAMVVGDGRPFIAAIVTIEPDSFETWSKEHDHAGASVASMVDDPKLRAEIQEAVDFANESVSKAESIRKFVILPSDLELGADEITPTLKVRRMVVLEHYADAVEALYG